MFPLSVDQVRAAEVADLAGPLTGLDDEQIMAASTDQAEALIWPRSG